MRPPKLRLLYAAAEVYPFAKAGGLGDVAGALPRALADRGHDVRVLLPHYPWLDEGAEVAAADVSLGAETEQVRLRRHGRYRGVEFYSVANGDHFGRDRIYGYEDDDARWILFSKAVAAFVHAAGGPADVLHVNDWHLGLVPQALGRGAGRPRTVITLHNLGLQGPPGGRGQRRLIAPDDRFTGTLLARGIVLADRVNTVSERYLREVLTPEQGMGLDRLLRRRGHDVSAIRNGLDEGEFDPARDPRIAARYDARSPERKTANKVELQRRSGLAVAPDAPVAGVVARLVGQKGVDLVLAAVEDLMALDLQLVVAGLGEPRYRLALERAAQRHPGRLAYLPTDHEATARRIYAAADLFLAPSAYEPCGLAPLIALRYGAIPVVRRTGGLAETVPDVATDPRRGLGFTFGDRRAPELVAAVERALALRRRPERWRELRRRAMEARFSWDDAARSYEALYLDALRRPGRPPVPKPASDWPAPR